jgi:hypothetical protein
MKTTRWKFLLVTIILAITTSVFGGNPQLQLSPEERTMIKSSEPTSIKGVKIQKAVVNVLNAFRVKQVTFQKVSINNQTHIAAAVIFNKNIDASTVKQNLNIRLLKKTPNNFWVDASTQNNTVQIRPNFITWVCGAPLEETGIYKMHLRGTIKSTDGEYLDCNGDGKGEGGNLPAYESQTYQAVVSIIQGIEDLR